MSKGRGNQVMRNCLNRKNICRDFYEGIPVKFKDIPRQNILIPNSDNKISFIVFWIKCSYLKW